MYRLEVIVIDDGVPIVAGDRPEVIKAITVGHTYNKLDLALKLAVRAAEVFNTQELAITGKRQR